jgi:transposase-like protein
MDSHKFSAQVERLEVVETGRRRRWSEDEKLKIVLESLQTPRAVSSTARRHPANALVGPLRRTNSVAARAPLVTLQDAAAYITALPKKEADTAEWQAAIESLMLVAEWAARQCLRASRYATARMSTRPCMMASPLARCGLRERRTNTAFRERGNRIAGRRQQKSRHRG